MSLTATLRPPLFSLNSPAPRDESVTFHHEAAYVALKRRLLRYQHLILLTPAPGTNPSDELTPLQRQVQAELWSPLPYHRTKWLHNVEGARNLLLQLERTARNIKVQRTRQQAQKDLAEKRLAIKRLRTRIEDIGQEVEAMGSESWKLPLPDVPGETAWDLLQVRGQAQAARTPTQAERVEQADAALREGQPVENVLEEMAGAEMAGGEIAGREMAGREMAGREMAGREMAGAETAGAETAGAETAGDDPGDKEEQQRESLFTSSGTVRRRGGGAGDQRHGETASNTSDQAATSGYSGLSTNERALLDSSRTQEALTTSMISMAAQLKQQAKAFQFSLEQDKGLLDRALEGLDNNLRGMQAAGKNMQFLQRMSEEQGWLGRLKLYVLIMTMWAVAILLVFAGPKLRF
ncbi:hypothetical protein DV737_g3423, partial [Chaetothyriales sp. CBS 132003]